MREMKDSGNVFIGNIPQDWRLMRLKFCLAKPLRSGTTDDPMEYSPELPRYIRISDIDKGGNLRSDTKVAIPFERAKGYILEDDTVLFASCGGTVGKAFLYKKEMGFSTYASYLIAAQANSAKVLPEWIYYFSKSATYFEWLQCSFTQSTIQNINSTKYGNLPLAVPEVSVQKRIIAYLDRKCADIDNVLEKTKASIEEYKKLKQSVITEAVTKGVRGPRPMKDSGIEWIGEIPEDWMLVKLKLITSKIGSGYTPKGGAEIYTNHGVKFIRSQNVYFEGFRLDDVAHITTDIDEEMKGTRVKVGDILFNITGGSIGRCRYVDESLGNANVNQHVCIVRPSSSIETKFLFYYLQSEKGQTQVTLSQTGGNREGLSASAFGDFKITLPVKIEQQEIASFLDQKCSEIDSLIESKERFIKELEAYRKSLIYEYVTGKKEDPTEA